MTEAEKYLFDLQGFLVVEDALAPDQLQELNDILDQRITQEVSAHYFRCLNGIMRNGLFVVAYNPDMTERQKAILTPPRAHR